MYFNIGTIYIQMIQIYIYIQIYTDDRDMDISML